MPRPPGAGQGILKDLVAQGAVERVKVGRAIEHHPPKGRQRDQVAGRSAVTVTELHPDTCQVCGYSTTAPSYVECDEAVEVGDLALRVAEYLDRPRLTRPLSTSLGGTESAAGVGAPSQTVLHGPSHLIRCWIVRRDLSMFRRGVETIPAGEDLSTKLTAPSPGPPMRMVVE